MRQVRSPFGASVSGIASTSVVSADSSSSRSTRGSSGEGLGFGGGAEGLGAGGAIASPRARADGRGIGGRCRIDPTAGKRLARGAGRVAGPGGTEAALRPGGGALARGVGGGTDRGGIGGGAEAA
jgi:hypothetical protein